MATKQRYKCGKCGFGWTPRTAEIPRRCPYCSKSDSIETPTADSKFTDVDDLLN